MNIYVSNLSFGIQNEELKQLFEQYGEVSSAKVITDKMSGRSKGFAFVEMPDDSAAQQAIEALNNYDVKGRPLRVSEARPRPEGEERSFNRERKPYNNRY